jgi:hypothetical protein
MPAKGLGISVGASLESIGSLTMDAFTLEDLGINPARGCSTAPATSAEPMPVLVLGLGSWGAGRTVAAEARSALRQAQRDRLGTDSPGPKGVPAPRLRD